jgi:DNA-binding CsgD family transcriptional regulator/GAF domain-containing protein
MHAVQAWPEAADAAPSGGVTVGDHRLIRAHDGRGSPLAGHLVQGADMDTLRSLLGRVEVHTGVVAGPGVHGAVRYAVAHRALAVAWDAARAALEGALGGGVAPGEDAVALVELLSDVRALAERLRTQELAGRELATGRVREMLGLLHDIDSTAVLIEQAVAAVCQLGFDRAIVSRVENDIWVAESVYVGRDHRWAEDILKAGRENPQLVERWLVEADVLRTGASVIVPDVAELPAVNRPIAEASLSRSYVAAPITAHGKVIGFLHADCYYQGRVPDETDREVLARFGEDLGHALARTAAMDRLAGLRADIARLSSGLAAPAAKMWPLAGEAGQEPPDRATGIPGGSGRLVLAAPPDGALTRREVDVLEWMARGETNARIARRLVISEGTVKSHVQNILRKLGAGNRAEAVSRWAELQAPSGRRAR